MDRGRFAADPVHGPSPQTQSRPVKELCGGSYEKTGGARLAGERHRTGSAGCVRHTK